MIGRIIVNDFGVKNKRVRIAKKRGKIIQIIEYKRSRNMDMCQRNEVKSRVV